jgi:glutamate N-acetyltransferase / amino-acid N-acetyltransferase
LVEAAPGTTAAALFTKNDVVAAPVKVGRSLLAKTRGQVRAIIVNSGNANCATGRTGIKACQHVCRETASALGVRCEEVFPSSTGIIGVPLPTKKIIAHLPALIAARASSRQRLAQFAKAIMTTDTKPKLEYASFRAAEAEVRLLGTAKGSGMIHPQLATMLVYLFTDVVATPSELRGLLHQACDHSFNCISVDGDTSTNDTVLLLASGQSGVRLSGSSRQEFADALKAVCQGLAEQIVADGEGVQHVIRLSIEQAKDRKEALYVARAIAHSLLVKTAWAGADPNWGRILAAIGACGRAIDPNRINIVIGSQIVCRSGTACAFDEQKAHADLAQPECDVRVRLGRGHGNALFLTTDLTTQYVRFNADYST